MSYWQQIFSLFGSTQQEQAEALGIPQQRISEKIHGSRASQAEEVSILVAGLALKYLTSKEKEQLRKKVIKELRR